MNHRLLPLLVLAAALAGCGGQPPAAEAPSPSASPCLSVSAEKLAAIAGGAEDNLPITPVAGAAVESNDYKDAYMIAMKFSLSDGSESVGVWLSNKLETDGMILAVDGFAQEFTHWPKADETSYEISPRAHGVDESEACVK